MASVIPGFSYQTTATVLVDTSDTTCLTVSQGAQSYYVTQIICADDGGAARTVTITAVIGGTTYTIVYQGAIAANVPYEIELKPLVLRYNRASSTGDTIKVTGSAAGIHVIISYIVNTRPTTGSLNQTAA